MPHQCPECRGTGMVPMGNFNPVQVPCTNPQCRAGVIYDEPVDNGGGGQASRTPTVRDIITLAVIALMVIALIYFIKKA